MLAVQGPRSDEVLRGARAARPGTTTCRSSRPTGRGARSSSAAPATPASAATSWSPRWDDAPALWDALLEAGAPYDGLPCGLGRARHPAHRDGLSAARPGPLAWTSPRCRPGAGWAVGWKKDAFWGRDALRRGEGGRRRAGCPGGCSRPVAASRGAHGGAWTRDGEPLGEVTSGTFSPTLKQGIALALLEPASRRVTRSWSTCAATRGRCDRRPAALRAGPDAARRARSLSRVGPPPGLRTAGTRGSPAARTPGFSRRAAGRARRS